MDIFSREFYEDVDKLRSFFELNNHSAHRETLIRILLRYEELRQRANTIALGHGTSIDFRDALEANTDKKTRDMISSLEKWHKEEEEKADFLLELIRQASFYVEEPWTTKFNDAIKKCELGRFGGQ